MLPLSPARVLSASLAIGLALLPFAAPAAPESGPASKLAFSRIAARFVNESEQRDPLFADGLGIHAYDDRLDDYSEAGHDKRITWLVAWETRLAAIPATLLSAGDAADRRALQDTIDLELFEDRTIAPVHTDPTVYTSVIGEALYTLTGRHYAPLSQRLAHAAPRLTRIPGIVRAAEKMLTKPTRVSTLQAIDDNAGNIELYTSLTAEAKTAPAPIRAAIARRLPATLTSLRQFGRYLRHVLLPRSHRNPRVGAYVFDRELQLQAGTDETRAQLVSDALADFKKNRAEMLQLAIPFDRKFFPKDAVDETLPAAQDIVIRRVLDRLANAHPSRTTIFSTAKADVASIEAFLTQHPVVKLPQPATLSVVPTPDFMAGFSGASMESSGPFAPLGESYFYIDKIPKTWDAERVSSYLRDYNDYEIKMLAIHEAVPGHYVQFRYGSRVPSLVRRVFSNGSYVEGWAVYGEGMILDAGYDAADPAMRLFQLKWRLREEANVLIDAAFHTGDLTLPRCEDLLERLAFQEHSEAIGKWHRLQLSHDQLTTYFVGLDAIRQAEASERERLGSAFDVADFNKRLLQMGGVEPRYIGPLLSPVFETSPNGQ